MLIKAAQMDVIRACNDCHPFKKNLSALETKSLADLGKRIDITIKPADKGVATVVMDTADYITEANGQLGNTSFYKRLDADPTGDYKTVLDTTIRKLVKGKELNDRAISLAPLSPVAGRFYLLLKIHKQYNHGRPIASGRGTATENFSHYVDSLISQVPLTFQSLLRLTNHFLRI